MQTATDRLYVSNWLFGDARVVDLTNQVELSPLPVGAGVYRLNAGRPGRLVTKDRYFDHLALVNSTNGSKTATRWIDAGEGKTDPTGRYYYHAGFHSGGADVFKFDLANDTFVQVASGTVSGYQSGTDIVMSLDGSRLFIQNHVFDAKLQLITNLLGAVLTCTSNGSMAFGYSGVYQPSTGQAIATLPFSSSVMAVDRNDRRLWYFSTVTKRIRSISVNSLKVLRIDYQPQNATAALGQEVYLTVAASGFGPIAFQWQKNGTNIPGATGAALTLRSQTPTSDNYRVIVSNEASTLTSSNATVRIGLLPSRPTGLTVTRVSSYEVELHWECPDKDITSFIVWVGSSDWPKWEDFIWGSVEGNARDYIVATLPSETSYRFFVQAINNAGVSEKSAVVSARTFPEPPFSPSPLTATALSPNRVQLSWHNPTNATGVLLWRNVVGMPGSYLATVKSPYTNYVDHTVHSGLTYRYVARAYNGPSASGNSLPATVTLPVGLADNLVWQNTNGNFSIWVMNGTNVVGYRTNTPSGPDANSGWRVAALGDLNGDFHTDIIWQNTNGAISSWYMTNTARRWIINLPAGSAVTTGWSIASAPDLNSDGKADLLWVNANTGATASWFLQGTNSPTAVSLRTGPTAANGWLLAGTADFNGDSKRDILWSKTTGLGQVWSMNRTNFVSSSFVPTTYTAEAGWRLAALVDLDGDQRTDWVWANTDGRVECSLMNGTNFIKSVTLPTNAPGWMLIGPR